MEPPARGTALTPGRTLVIYKPVSADSAEGSASEPKARDAPAAQSPAARPQPAKPARKRAKYHKVKKGETLSSIAESNHTSVAALKRDNPKLDARPPRRRRALIIRK